MQYLSALLFLFAISNQAFGTIVKIDKLPQMAEDSEIIAHIVIGEQTQNLDEEMRPVLLSTAEVLKGIKGVQTGELLTIYQVFPGQISGQSHFELGEELVLFGMKYNGMVISYGVGLGKFGVLRARNQTKVVEDLHDLVAVRNDLRGTHFAAPIARRFKSLEEFFSQIADAINTPYMIVPVGPKGVKAR